MTRSLTIRLSSGALSAAALCVFSFPAFAHTPSEIETLASRTAERVTKTRQQHIFVAGLKECQLDTQVCTLFERSLHADLEKMIPGVHFVKRENVINILEGRGFIAIDAYFPDVLKAVATSAGADILVTDTLEWLSDGYELNSEVYDAVQMKKVDQFRAKIARPVPDSDGEPLVFTDPESGVFLIVSRGNENHTQFAEYPKCVRCPDPSLTPEAKAHRTQGRVLIMATVTEQGGVEHLGVVDGLGDGLTGLAVETVRNWKFKPAIGKDAKPIAARVPIEIVFR
jgi:TonB family protein